MNKEIAVNSDIFNSVDTIVAFVGDFDYIVGVTTKTSNDKNSFIGIVLQSGNSGAVVGVETHFTKAYFVPTDYSLVTKI